MNPTSRPYLELTQRFEQSVPAALSKPVLILLLLTAAFGALFGGPLLGDHEALVGVIARNMRMSGDWLVPVFLGDPFVRKPPLSYWLVAAASYILPPDGHTGLPVSTLAARLPSAVAALGTVLLLWRLSSWMFGAFAGRVTALVASASVLVLLFAPNATAEMPLTFCCTWAAVHFWRAIELTGKRRLLHLALFYIALGVGMLAKGPAPMALLAVPLALWWYTQRPQRILARGGEGAWKKAGMCLFRGLAQQTVRAFTRLWVFPGIFLFAAVFVPWMVAVARQDASAWNLWNWQYLQRFEGDYADTKKRGLFYFLPIAAGFTLPWTVFLIEGLLSPWLRKYAAIRRQLYFLGVWGVAGIAVMSVMSFKKPYYIAPAIPPLLILSAVPLVHWIQGGVGFRRANAAALLGALTCAAFLFGWYGIAPSFDNARRVAILDEMLDQRGVPADEPVYFADQRPDARLAFYYARKCDYLLEPAEVVSRIVDRSRAMAELRDLAVEKATHVLREDSSTYLLIDREHLPTLEMLGERLHLGLQIAATIDLDGQSDADDWILLTNQRSAIP